jgi:uncharacterized coiled-coil protein SlyX
MKPHYPVLIGTMFLFISTTAVAHDDERLKVIEEKLQEQQSKIGTLLETVAAQEEAIGENHLKIAELLSRNTDLEGKISTAQATANTAVSNAAASQTRANLGVSKADTAQATANTAVSNATAAQTRANLGVSKADTAQATANTAVSNAAAARTRANLGVSKADTAQTTANTANGKHCYITGSGFGMQWAKCPYGGTYKGGIDIQRAVAGIKQQEVWTYTHHLWLCCL